MFLGQVNLNFSGTCTLLWLHYRCVVSCWYRYLSAGYFCMQPFIGCIFSIGNQCLNIVLNLVQLYDEWCYSYQLLIVLSDYFDIHELHGWNKRSRNHTHNSLINEELVNIIDNPEIRNWATVKFTVYLLYDAHVVGNADRTAMLRYYVTYNRAC